MMRVLIAVEQEGLRSALRFVLEQESGMAPVGVVADGPALLCACTDLAPDVLLLDWELPGFPRDARGARTLSALYAAAPQLHVLVLSGRPEARAAAMAAGAHRFVSKADPPEKLIAALRALHDDSAQRDAG